MRIVSADRIIDGESVFRLMDSHGLPLDVIRDELRQREMGFDLLGFCRAALRSGNYPPEKIKAKVLQNLDTDTSEIKSVLEDILCQ